VISGEELRDDDPDHSEPSADGEYREGRFWAELGLSREVPGNPMLP
jgi:hypothetical protein